MRACVSVFFCLCLCMYVRVCVCLHRCMSFELLGDHLSDVLKQNGKPFKMESIRDVSFQLLQAIAYVHSKNIIHTDLKVCV